MTDKKIDHTLPACDAPATLLVRLAADSEKEIAKSKGVRESERPQTGVLGQLNAMSPRF